MDPKAERLERLAGGLFIWISDADGFGSDAFLLADFARPRGGSLVCDLGAGCGIIPLLLLRAVFAPERITAVELRPEAVRLMRRTAEQNGLRDRLCPICADLRDPAAIPDAGRYELVTCNPPYFARDTGYTAPDPARLTARHEVSCTVDDVCTCAARLLKYGGRLCMCHRPERLPDVLEALRRHGLEPKRIRFVQQREGAAPWLFLVEGKKGGRPSLAFLPPLTVESPAGGFSDQMKRIYSLEQDAARA